MEKMQKMAPLERLKCTRAYLDEKLQEDLEEAKDDAVIKEVIRDTYQEHVEAFDLAIKIVEANPLKTIYISGPITNNPDYKRDFNRVENELQIKGYTVLNPSNLPKGLTNADYMKLSLAQIDAADAVVLLPNWETSQGARLEVDYCRYTGKLVYLSPAALGAHDKMMKEAEENAALNA